MNFCQQLEDCLRDLAAEARNQHPGVREASERATLTLRSLQHQYMAQVRQGTPHATQLFRHSDLLHPFLLAANYPTASPELLATTFRAMRLLLDHNVVLDGLHLVRVWTIQATVIVAATTTAKGAASSTTAATATTSSSSSWFSWGSNSGSSTEHKKVHNAVSSSSGQTGRTQPHYDMEKRALEILSLLLQLLQQSTDISNELWTHSVALTCLFRDAGSHKLQQASHTTLSQVLTLLFQTSADDDFLRRTWDDLLALAVSSKSKLHGALALSAKPPLHLDLLPAVWKEWSDHPPLQKTLQTTLTLLQHSPDARTLQWMLQLVPECTPAEAEQLFQACLPCIVQATEACRKHDDFEDGYIYQGDDTMGDETMTTLIPQPLLRQAAWALEATASWPSSPPAEVWSDFLTIATSCRPHILQLVHAGEQRSLWRVDEPTLGDALQWALSNVLAAIPDGGGDLTDTFAPVLSVLQHCLKRVPGSPDLVLRTLQGYLSLAQVCFATSASLQRKALVSSLCKLSLPAWGKHDPSSQLQDHHIQVLLTLLKLVHMHHDDLTIEWEVILWTLQELSVLSIASADLSDASYSGALAVSATFGRMPAFSACLSKESLVSLVEGLAQISTTIMAKRDVAGSSDTVLPDRPTSMSSNTVASQADAKDSSISEKIMNIGVRAIYGSSGESEKVAAPSMGDRTRNTYYEEYRRDFVRRIDESRATVRISSIGRLPFVLTLLADVAMANSFRYNECGDVISEHLSNLAARSAAVRPFCMDVIAMLTMSHISDDSSSPTPSIGPTRVVFGNPMTSQMLATEPFEATGNGSAKSLSQSELLAPVCETLKTTAKHEVAESTLESLKSVLEGSGHRLSGQVWILVIEAIASLSGDPSYDVVDRSSSKWSKCCLSAFACLKLIVNDFKDEMQSSSTVTEPKSIQHVLLDCCTSFAMSRHDINTSLTAIGLLWSVADQDSDRLSVSLVLSILVQLAADQRPELRNASVNTLFSCITGRGNTFTSDDWESCMVERVFVVYDMVATHLERGSTSETGAGATSRYSVSLHHSQDSAEKQWMATQVLVLRGLVKVLRMFFDRILETTGAPSAKKGDHPWFQDAWVRILDFGFDAAAHIGDVSSLGYRSTGVEILNICCQLASSTGIQALGNSASVDTSMTVVNGALKAVEGSAAEDSGPIKPRHRTETVEKSRRKLFDEAFESLESFRDHACQSWGSLDDVQVQVLEKFSSGLANTYSCCRSHEFEEDEPAVALVRIQSLSATNPEEASAPTRILQTRFVSLIGSVLELATKGRPQSSTFLNQAQKSAMELLHRMATSGSVEAFDLLVSTADAAFWLRKDQENGERGYATTTSIEDSLGIVNFEASVYASKAISGEALSSHCQAYVLAKVLGSYMRSQRSEERPTTRKLYYKRLLPIVQFGVRALHLLSNDEHDHATDASYDALWCLYFDVLSSMMNPQPINKDMTKIPRVSELCEMVESSSDCVPLRHIPAFVDLLATCSTTCFNVASLHMVYSRNHADSENGKKSKKHYDEVLKLLTACFSSAIALNPSDPSPRAVVRLVTLRVSNGESDHEDYDVSVDATLIVCKAMTGENRHTEELVMACFSELVRLLSSSNGKVRTAAEGLFASTNVTRTLEELENRAREAEQRAATTEATVATLQATIQRLEAQNAELRREVAVLEASAAL